MGKKNNKLVLEGDDTKDAFNKRCEDLLRTTDLNYTNIGEELGCSRWYVRKLAYGIGLGRSPYKNQTKVSIADKKEIAAMFEDICCTKQMVSCLQGKHI